MFPTYHAINLPKISQACSCIIPLKVKENKHKSFWLIDVSKSQWDPLQFPKESIVLSKSSKSCPPQRTINLNKFGSLLDSPPKKCTSQIEQSSHVATSKNMFFFSGWIIFPCNQTAKLFLNSTFYKQSTKKSLRNPPLSSLFCWSIPLPLKRPLPWEECSWRT